MPTIAVLALAAVPVAALLAYGIVCALVAHRFTTARRLPPKARLHGIDLTPDSVRFAARDERCLVAGWYLAAKPRRAAVILVHGKDACRGAVFKHDGIEPAHALVRAGISVLAIDLRGHGHSGAGRMTYGATEQLDVLGAYDWLLARGYAPGSIGILGASMGAATAIFAAADEPGIAAVLADSPFDAFASMMARHFRKLSGLPAFVLPGALAIARLLTGVDYGAIRPLAAARRLAGRAVLVVHASGDRFIPALQGRAVAAAAGGRFVATEATSHLGSFEHEPEAYCARATAFFAEALGAASTRETSSQVARGAADSPWQRAA